jgi:hypothetical protein
MVTSVSKEEKFKIDQLISNEPEEIVIPNLWKGKVRLPTIKEKLSVREEVKNLPSFSLLTEDEQKLEEAKLLALKMIVEPKYTVEDYLSAPDGVINTILDTVSLWYASKLKAINDRRKELVDHFLEEMEIEQTERRK